MVLKYDGKSISQGTFIAMQYIMGFQIMAKACRIIDYKHPEPAFVFIFPAGDLLLNVSMVFRILHFEYWFAPGVKKWDTLTDKDRSI
jgi:hypothetical protein